MPTELRVQCTKKRVKLAGIPGRRPKYITKMTLFPVFIVLGFRALNEQTPAFVEKAEVWYHFHRPDRDFSSWLAALLGGFNRPCPDWR
jgi:hypothetical protein